VPKTGPSDWICRAQMKSAQISQNYQALLTNFQSFYSHLSYSPIQTNYQKGK